MTANTASAPRTPGFDSDAFNTAFDALKRATQEGFNEKALKKIQPAIASALWFSHIDPAIMDDTRYNRISTGTFTVERTTANGNSYWKPV